MNYKELLNNKFVGYAIAFAIGVGSCWFLYPTKTIEENIRQETSITYQEKIDTLTKQHAKEIDELELMNTKITIATSEDFNQREEILKSQVSFLVMENEQLHKTTNEEWVKITKPDGSIEEKKIVKTELDKSTQRSTQVQEEIAKAVISETQRIQESKTEEISTLSKKHVAELEILNKSVTEKEQTIKQLQESSKITTVNAKKLGIGFGTDTNLKLSVYGQYTLFGPVYLGARIDNSLQFKEPTAAIFIGISL